jgi:hypothetical protein
MRELRYTLLADGTSDKALLPILTWLLREHRVRRPIQPEWADLQRLRTIPRRLRDRIYWSLQLFPCDLLFVHRDAERALRADRVREIQAAWVEIRMRQPLPPVVCVVPVRMQEAWLLLHEPALRRAAGNPRGRQALAMPAPAILEEVPDPKALLHQLLREASGLRGRRRRDLDVQFAAQRLAGLIEDFAPLRALPAFRALEADVEQIVRENDWHL